MRVVILGAAGFLGSRLAARLAADASICNRVIEELVLADARPARVPERTACSLVQCEGDLRDGALLDDLFARPVDVLVHLAATLTVQAEADFRHGLETNVLGVIDLLERCRLQATAPMLLFASSIATFGGQLPPVVGDDVHQAPATSYGTHKAITELLLADYSRHGFVDGRALRLPIVVTHPGPPTGSISDQVASLIREPLHGQRTTCQFAPGTRMVVASVDKVVEGFLRLASLPVSSLPPGRTMNMPGLTVTPEEIEKAVLRRRDGADGWVDWRPEPKVQRVIDGWPTAFTSARALALGFTPDASADSLVDAFIASEHRT